jgi:hypothetical protein
MNSLIAILFVSCLLPLLWILHIYSVRRAKYLVKSELGFLPEPVNEKEKPEQTYVCDTKMSQRISNQNQSTTNPGENNLMVEAC